VVAVEPVVIGASVWLSLVAAGVGAGCSVKAASAENDRARTMTVRIFHRLTPDFIW
jgi:hypothetical protein